MSDSGGINGSVSSDGSVWRSVALSADFFFLHSFIFETYIAPLRERCWVLT